MRKNILVYGIAVGLVAVYFFLIMPLSQKKAEIRESIIEEYSTLKRYEMFIGRGGVIESEIKNAVNEVDRLEEGIFKKTIESLAFARLQGYVQDFAEKSGVRIYAIRPMPVVKYNSYYSLPIYAEGSCEIKQLSEFLRLLDSGREFVKIDKLNISVANVQMPKELKLKLQFSGLMNL